MKPDNGSFGDLAGANQVRVDVSCSDDRQFKIRARRWDEHCQDMVFKEEKRKNVADVTEMEGRAGIGDFAIFVVPEISR